MKKVKFLLIISIHFSCACRSQGAWRGAPRGKNEKAKDKFFSSGTSWGGWSPPKGNNDWKEWIDKWGKDRTTDEPGSNEWKSEHGPESAWLQGYGPGITGVPPPPWAYVPESFDKPQLCFYIPRFGHCSKNVTRWGFNPSNMRCQTFFYSGCGGNDNNFMNKTLCEATCVRPASPDCEIEPAVNFEEMINQDFDSH